MAANQKVIEKNKKILGNLSTQVESVDNDFLMFKDLDKKREKEKKKYEHYKVKLRKLRE